jgi:Ribonucleotide reductase, all-alpha domain
MTPQLPDNALTVLQARYLNRDHSGQILESPEDLCRRVSHMIAQAEGRFGPDRAVVRWQEAFFQALTQLDFVPNSPTRMNAGTSLGQLSAYFVLPVEDSMVGIFDALKLAALIQQSGGARALPSHGCGRGTTWSPPLAAAPRVRCLSCASLTVPPNPFVKAVGDGAPIWGCHGSIIPILKPLSRPNATARAFTTSISQSALPMRLWRRLRRGKPWTCGIRIRADGAHRLGDAYPVSDY